MPEPKHPMHRSTSVVTLGRVSVKGLQTALRDFYDDTGQNATQAGLTSVDFGIIDKALNGLAGSGKPCQIENPATGTIVTCSVWPSGVSSGQAALSGFSNER